ncbi:(2Fe-2S)-binding protein [Nocardiopsis rhodophaea]
MRAYARRPVEGRTVGPEPRQAKCGSAPKAGEVGWGGPRATPPDTRAGARSARMDPMTDPMLRAVLSDIGTINPFFAVESDLAGEGWVPIDGLWRRPELLAAEIADVRRRLAGRAQVPEDQVEPRVAASILYQGLASRLLSPVIAAALCHDRVPDPAALHWSPARTGPLVFALRDGPGLASPTAPARGRDGADLVSDRVITAVLAPIGEAIRAQVKVAPRLLWGNAASSLAGTVQQLAEARPGHAAAVMALATQLMNRPPLAGLGEFARPGATDARFFSRSTCCLYYRIPGCAKCGDCALLPARRTRPTSAR